MRKIAVALGGGGIRGIAHIGALLALEDMNYQVSEIYGTSIGAVIASLYARGYTAKQLALVAKDMSWKDILKVEKTLTTLYTNRSQVMNCQVVVTDVVVNVAHYFPPTPKTVAMSCAIPGLPGFKEYCDGCVTDNVPMRMMRTKRRIGFNVIPTRNIQVKSYAHKLSRIIDICCLRMQTRKNVLDIVPNYVDPFDTRKKTYKKLIRDAYFITREYLDDKVSIDQFDLDIIDRFLTRVFG